jgi:DHA2 family multidrug resistance protein-like MFS transporter
VTGSEAPPLAGKREWAGLAVLSLATLLVSFDMFVLLLALPHLTSALGPTSTEQLWIMDIYGFMVGGFLITMGNLGDRIGRRKLLLIGAAMFGAASVLSAFSTSPEMLIAARALLGIAGATLGPSTLALISTMFPNPKQMGAAIGVWGATFSAGAIIGPIVGGLLLAHFWWGSVFLIGVPAMVIMLIFGPILLPEAKNPNPGKLDPLSVVLSLAAILPFIYGVKEIARSGWQVVPIITIVVGLAIAVAFVRRQRHLDDPLLDLGLFKVKDFTVGLGSLLLFSIVGGAALLFITQFFQSVAGLSSLQAAFALLPGMAVTLVSITQSSKLAARIRPAYVIAAGLVVAAAGFFIYTQVGVDSGPAGVIIGFAVVCLGGGPLLGIGMGLVMSSAPPEKMGAASALPQVSNELGGSLGVAALGALGVVIYRTVLDVPAGTPAEASAAAHESIAGAVSTADGLPAGTGSGLVEAARTAFSDGFHTVASVGVGVMLLISVLVFTKLKHIPAFGAQAATGGGQPGEDPETVPAGESEADSVPASS